MSLLLQVALGHDREVVFRQGTNRRLVAEVQVLRAMSDDITDQNSQIDLPYPYLCHKLIESSVSIGLSNNKIRFFISRYALLVSDAYYND